MENYTLDEGCLKLRGTQITLDQADSPTFIGLRQKEFCAQISCEVRITGGEAGITLYMDENHHYDLAIRRVGHGFAVIERLNIGDVKSVEKVVERQQDNHASLLIRA